MPSIRCTIDETLRATALSRLHIGALCALPSVRRPHLRHYDSLAQNFCVCCHHKARTQHRRRCNAHSGRTACERNVRQESLVSDNMVADAARASETEQETDSNIDLEVLQHCLPEYTNTVGLSTANLAIVRGRQDAKRLNKSAAPSGANCPLRHRQNHTSYRVVLARSLCR